MGWGSAGYSIFDPVVSTLIDSGCPDHAIQEVAERLIGVLIAEDWDTYDKSLDQFRGCSPIVRAFNRWGLVARTQMVNGEVTDMIRCQGCDTLTKYTYDSDEALHSQPHTDPQTGKPCGHSGLDPHGHN